MKLVALILFLAASASGAAGDTTSLLDNGDFSNGLTHWEGNAHTAGSAQDDSGSTTGIVVKLRVGDWTKVTQDFTGKVADYILTITYALSSGLEFSDRPDYYADVTTKLGFTNYFVPFSSQKDKWVIIITDRGLNHYTYWKVSPTLGSTDVQTVQCEVSLDSDETHPKSFCLGFPPGSGFVNLQSISLVPKTSATAP
jgi:hypothetical protein